MRSIGRLGALAIAILAATLALVGTAAARPFDVLAADHADATILRIPPSGVVQTLASGPPLDSPYGLTMSVDGRIYVADGSAGVLTVTPPSETATVLNDDLPPFSEPLDVDRGPDGFLYVTEENGGTGVPGIYRMDPDTGAYTPFATADLLQDPYALVFTPSGSMYVADQVSGIVRVSATGAQSQVSNDPALGSSPAGVAFDPHGVLYSNDGDDRIFRVNLATGAATEVASGGDLTGLYHLQFEPRGTLLAASSGNGRIVRVNPRTGAQFVIPGGQLNGAEAVTIEPPKCAGKRATVIGTSRRDKIKTTRYADVIATLGGNDAVRGLAGNDRVCGGPGRDKLIGGPGSDRLIGGKGRDQLVGGPGHDRQRQ